MTRIHSSPHPSLAHWHTPRLPSASPPSHAIAVRSHRRPPDLRRRRPNPPSSPLRAAAILSHRSLVAIPTRSPPPPSSPIGTEAIRTQIRASITQIHRAWRVAASTCSHSKGGHPPPALTSSPRSSGAAALDLNSQAAAPTVAMEEFPHLAEYGNFLHGGGGGDQGLSGRESSLPPIRVQRTLGVRSQRLAGGGGGMGATVAGRTRQLNFGAVSHDGGVFLGGLSLGSGSYRGGSSSMGGGGRPQRAMAASRGAGRRRGSGRGGCRGAHAPLPPQVPLQAPGGNFVNLDGEDEDEDGNEDYGSSGGPPVSNFRANWSDQNNARLLRLCMKQLRAGNYVDKQMNGQGYKALAKGYYEQTGLLHDKKQFRIQIGQLRSTYSFWSFLQKHTGLGRKPDGTIDAESEFWKTCRKGKVYLNKLKNGHPPPNFAELEEMFSGSTVDGTTGFVPGQNFFEEDNPVDNPLGDDEDEENLVATPTSTSSRKSKRSLGSTTNTADSTIKKSKSPMMVRYMKQIANTFSETVQVNQQVMKKCVAENMDARKEKDSFSVKRCQELAFDCGIQQDTSEVYAMGRMFQDAFQREFFCGLPTAEARLVYFKNWLQGP
ncbi:hypothetical protein C2845_PM03G05500 [Panicum miliaceum]|uniref:Myb/SANT-like domain-containing protein n=1 Tax=Panicum miliaceum TaxID=4540 RepID=A0A3L6T596_PANMI|nr:hypothetical protein C2845_PM03G05500 [Panicum miliaceum]